jgi:hypothetical protein
MIRYCVLLFLLIFIFMQRVVYAVVVLPQSVDVTGLEALVGLIVAALTAIWCVRKLIKYTNRS